jgi:hypothetical protein
VVRVRSIQHAPPYGRLALGKDDAQVRYSDGWNTRLRQSEPAPTSTASRTTSWPPTCPQQPDQPAPPRLKSGETPCIADVSALHMRIFILRWLTC